MTPFLIIRFFCFLDIPRYGVPRGTARVSFVARGMESFNFHAKRISPFRGAGTSFYPAAVWTADREETSMRSVGIGFGG